MITIRFNDALRIAAEAASAFAEKYDMPVRLIRDIYGRIRFALDREREACSEEAANFLKAYAAKLGPYSTNGTPLFRDDFADADSLFNHPDWHETLVPGNVDDDDDDGVVGPELVVALLDRQIVGQSWLRTDVSSGAATHPPRIVFYGLKGGVGRSTALAMLAHRLATLGKRVLLLDFDLESPGLSGLLLPPERVAGYGLVDWFVEDAVGDSDSIIDDIVADSPLAEHTPGQIRVVAAMGQGETAYLSKLARVYADIPSAQGGAEQFAHRMARIVEKLETREKPDVVLIDSRAGLHDLAAISIAGLSTVALLFATDTAQNWQGYQQLFGHWQRRPQVLRQVRQRLALVQALFPETEQAARAERFLQNAYDLFANNLYDRIEPGQETPIDAFTFSTDDEDAPHFPWQVRWSARLQEFNPLLPVERGGVGDADIQAAFGPFFDGVIAMALEE